MIIECTHFVPALKWKMGEYQALNFLEDTIKDKVVPLVTISPIGYDFEKKKVAKSVQEHIEGVPKKLNDKWQGRAMLIDIHSSLEAEVMDDGSSVIAHLFNELENDLVVPVTRIERSPSYQKDVKSIIKNTSRGIALSIGFNELMDQDINKNLEATAIYFEIENEQIDLIIDLENPGSYLPYEDFSQALVSLIREINGIDSYRSFVLQGASLNVSGIKKPGGLVDRHEWILYQELSTQLKAISVRIPSFGDYTIEPVGFLPEMDMRLINPAGKIVYSFEDKWLIEKGGAFRNDRPQMISHCKKIINSGHYLGRKFSYGDSRIEETALGAKNTGNHGTWKTVGINHHITLMVEQLSNFHGL